ncbi:Ras family [seawater metagenome]|uniref:Ras family n=1 Tax=seawater metagenome TaxID=1561972 RepID=A0A5E8CMI2_9ZZZZ
MNYNYLFKFILIGDSEVGKSAILSRFTNDTYNEDNPITIGVDFGAQTIEIDKKNIKLQIWDTAGQEKFSAIVNTYYRGAIGCLLVFDLTDRETFKSVKTKWLGELNYLAHSKIIITLVGSKYDKMNRQVSQQEAEDFAKENNFIYIETSARLNLNVNLAFQKTAEIILNKIISGEIEVSNKLGIRIGSFKKTNYFSSVNNEKKKCCF